MSVDRPTYGMRGSRKFCRRGSNNSTSVSLTQYNLVHNGGVNIIVQVSDRSPNTSIKLCTSKSMRVFTCLNTCCCYTSIVILNYVIAIIAIYTPIHLAIFPNTENNLTDNAI